MTAELFDEEWYLQTNPDVKNAGVNAYEHYLKFGKREGRLPYSLPSLPLERKLWESALGDSEDILVRLIEVSKSDTPNGMYSLWVSVSFLHFQKRFRELIPLANKLLEHELNSIALFSKEDVCLILIEALVITGEVAAAEKVVSDNESLSEVSRLLAKTAISNNHPSSKSSVLSKLFRRHNLSPVTLKRSAANFDGLTNAGHTPFYTKLISRMLGMFKVTVIVPAFNAQHTLDTSITSILQQSWENLEILIIDDCSTDNTYSVARELANTDKRIQLLRNKVNKGAYYTRNLGLKTASGKFVTIMDADDWAHAEKIEKQVLPLIFNRKLAATVSHWARCTEDLVFTRLRPKGGWVHRNVSSLLVRTEIAKRLGGWDIVKVNADTEFYYRLRAAKSTDCIKEVMPGVPLSLGRVTETSLTQQSETHLVTQYGGPRKQYTDFAHIWHKHAISLILERNNFSTTEPFTVPPALLKNVSAAHSQNNNIEFQRWLQALDEDWYLLANSDVEMRGIGLHEHYWQQGETEDRAPSPLFVPSAYRLCRLSDTALKPTWHALKNSWDFSKPVCLKGYKNLAGKHIVVVGHQVTLQLFGAERSLLDMLEVLAGQRYRVTLLLPTAKNNDYVQQCLAFVSEIQFIPLPWYNSQRKVSSVIVDYLTHFIKSADVAALYVNTLVLHEPLLAAKKAGVPSITHIRELPDHDADLMHILDETPRSCRQRLIDNCDYFVANSNETANWLDCKAKTKLVYNKVEIPQVIDNPPPFSRLQVCMLSSNIKKKGIDDFFQVAKRCEHNKDITFNLYGPITDEVRLALKSQSPKNVQTHGYVTDASQAIQQNHIVLSLSWFKESFGRTVAEAMINSRVVVGYKWGAVGELVEEGSGILVEYKDTSSVAQAILSLVEQQERYEALAQKAQKRAMQLFSGENYTSDLAAAIQGFLGKPEKLQ